ncbi:MULTISPECIES: ABC transporter substrate-binding protein [Fusobacterium]|uniref:ABC transporter substrate-binding protein n=1 Tax=Fusobacterium TaxID=848 RepID=UPI0008A3D746|nr:MULTISPECIES: ABC transporter substrate-binding protein [Fusobacterium]OFL89766.1 hemin receptor [Fusobacterium sp. HMSC073F01]
MKKIISLIYIILTFVISVYALGADGKKFNRIASLTLSGDEMILSLVNHKRIVGLCGKINEEPDMSHVWEIAKGFPKIESNIETMIDLEPDLVITADWMKKDVLLQIEETGTNVYTYKTPKNFEEQKKLIRELAELVGEKERGEALVKNMEDRLSALQKQITDNYKGKKLKVLMYTSYEYTSGKDTTFDDMVRLIGGINAAGEAGINGSQKISKEKVIELNPDVIIIPIWKGHINSEEFSAFVMNDPSFENLKAVKNKKIYLVKHKTLSPTSQYMIDGIEKLGKTIYNLKEE